jgi:hypothetical protein
METRRRNATEAMCDLLERVSGPIEVRGAGLWRMAVEVAAESLGSRAVTVR